VSPLLQSQATVVQPEAMVLTNAVTMSPGLAPEAMPLANAALSVPRSTDPGASLSLAAVGRTRQLGSHPRGFQVLKRRQVYWTKCTTSSVRF
jgi:hypothetical protein